jgi:hypothetical protein
MNGKSNFLLQRTADNTINSLRQIRFRNAAKADTKYSRNQYFFCSNLHKVVHYSTTEAAYQEFSFIDLRASA